MAASGNASTGKLVPAARIEDQEDRVEMKPIKISTPPFSSPDPATDGLRMKPLLEDEAAMEAAEAEVADEDKNSDDWKKAVKAATTQEELDAVADRYANSGKDYTSVDDTIEKKQTEIDEAAAASDGDGSDDNS
jgi:hypothetical protein